MRRLIALPLHKLAHRLDRMGWWITHGQEARRQKRADHIDGSRRANEEGGSVEA